MSGGKRPSKGERKHNRRKKAEVNYEALRRENQKRKEQNQKDKLDAWINLPKFVWLRGDQKCPHCKASRDNSTKEIKNFREGKMPIRICRNCGGKYRL